LERWASGPPTLSDRTVKQAEKALKNQVRGAFYYQSSEGVIVCDWFDNHRVTVVSNYHSVEATTPKKRCTVTVKRRSSSASSANLVVAFKSIGGVDQE
jgi:hypothetical protein